MESSDLEIGTHWPLTSAAKKTCHWAAGREGSWGIGLLWRGNLKMYCRAHLSRGTRDRSAYLIDYYHGATLGARKTEALLSSAQHPLMGELFTLDHGKTVWDSSADGSFDIRHIGRWRNLALLVSFGWRVGKYRLGVKSSCQHRMESCQTPVIPFLRRSMAFLSFHLLVLKTINESWNLRIPGCFTPCQMHDFSSYKIINDH